MRYQNIQQRVKSKITTAKLRLTAVETLQNQKVHNHRHHLKSKSAAAGILENRN